MHGRIIAIAFIAALAVVRPAHAQPRPTAAPEPEASQQWAPSKPAAAAEEPGSKSALLIAIFVSRQAPAALVQGVHAPPPAAFGVAR